MPLKLSLYKYYLYNFEPAHAHNNPILKGIDFAFNKHEEIKNGKKDFILTFNMQIKIVMIR